MSALPADVETFTGMMAKLLKEPGLAGDAAAAAPEQLAAIPQDYLMDCLMVMRRVGLDPGETACLSAIYLGMNQAPGAGGGINRSCGLAGAARCVGRGRA